MRLKCLEISQEIRTNLAAYAWPTLSISSIPTGRDPRFFSESDMFPTLVARVDSAITNPLAVGGAAEAFYSLSMFLLFKYNDSEDINEKKLQYASELFDFLCAHKTGTYYKIFALDKAEGSYPRVDFLPEEEQVYEQLGIRVAMLKMTTVLRQIPFFSIN